MTKMGPSSTKEDILWNNYEYDPEKIETKLRRVACYVEIHLPLEKVMDLSNHRDLGQDVWIWPDEPLVLAKFSHRFGVMDGTEDLHLKEGVMAVAERAYQSSLDKVQWDRAVIPECKEKKIRQNVREIFMMILESKYFKFDSDDPRFSHEPQVLMEKIGCFLLECAISNDSESFDKFLDIV